MENVQAKAKFIVTKEKFLYGVIGILILIIFGNSIFASTDEEKLRDSLSLIEKRIETLDKKKKDIATDLQVSVDMANSEIKTICSSIPEVTKKAVDCSKFTQDYKLILGTSTGGIAPVPEQQGNEIETLEGQAIDSPTLRKALNLKDCRFTNDHHRFPRDNISFQATDIACTPGESFTVYTPDWKDEYEVTSISYGTNLGNFIIVKSGDYHMVFGHTVAKEGLQVGQKLKGGESIGATNLSGKKNTGIHLHFELWEGGENINGRFIVGDKVIYSPDSEKLLKKRGWNWGENSEKKYWQAYEKAIDLLHSEEGIRIKEDGLTHAYPDYKGCSIGYGSRANSCDEKITIEEANKRLAYVVRDLTERIGNLYSKLGPDAQSALVSFAFNCHEGYQDVKKNGIQRHEIWCKKAGGVRLDTLVKRREKESLIIKADKNYLLYTK